MKIENPKSVIVTLADGQSRSQVIGITEKFPFVLSNIKYNILAFVIPSTNDFELILGMSWFMKADPMIRWSKKRMHISNGRAQARINFIGAHEFKRPTDDRW